jgi:5'-nucleotidase / UDP-sugar diphosphatase
MKRVSVLLLACILGLFLISGCGSSSSSSKEPTPPILSDGDMVSVKLIQTTDIHHRASGTGSSITYSPMDGIDGSGPGGADQTEGGYARLTAKINALRQSARDAGMPSLLVDSGDYLMGTVYDLTLGSTPAGFYFMEFMKYDAITIGNHEFDYGPAGLAMMINNARGDDGQGLTIPIVATNMVTDGMEGTADDSLEALVEAGVIDKTLLLTLDNGLKVGIIGLLGRNAQADVPQSAPVTFNHDFDFIQSNVDYLKNDLGAHIVIALSHSGITRPGENPGGDDVVLAQNVSGIDVIASGHEHEMTEEIVEINGTHIICAGYYGRGVAELDLTVVVGTGVTSAQLVNHVIDDSVPGNEVMNFIVEMFDAGINEALEPQLGIAVNDVIAGAGSPDLGKPAGSRESGIGNLVADSLRYMLGGEDGTIGIVANGVIRNGFSFGQQITFADMYSVLPLGMSPDPANQDVPGYPLMRIYLSGGHVANACQLAAYMIAAEDDMFMTQLANPAHPYHALYPALLNLKSSYYLNMSGVRYMHFDGSGLYQLVPDSVKIYDGMDFKCEFPPAAIDEEALYPAVIDIYMFMVMNSADLQMLLTGLGLPVTPVFADGTPITTANMMAARLDRDPETEGVQEIKEWMALLQFLTAGAEKGGFAGNIIPDANYGEAVLASGDTSRVTEVPAP